MDREPKKTASDLLGLLTWMLGGCMLAMLLIALLVMSLPRKTPRLNTTPGMTTGEEVSFRGSPLVRSAPL